LQIASEAYVHLLPNIAGYVGADHIARHPPGGGRWSNPCD
jgi:uncharacterized 2Fe-2S/4Fe-4S cluster protein (DUF4445 family)